MLPKLLYELMPVIYVSVGFARCTSSIQLLRYSFWNCVTDCCPHDFIHAFRKPHRSDRALRAPAYSEEEAKLGVVFLIQAPIIL